VVSFTTGPAASAASAVSGGDTCVTPRVPDQKLGKRVLWIIWEKTFGKVKKENMGKLERQQLGLWMTFII
jgi:hypothetical protein